MTRKHGEHWQVVAINRTVIFKDGSYQLRRAPSPPSGDREEVFALCDSRKQAEAFIGNLHRTLAECSIVRRHLKVAPGSDETAVLKKIGDGITV